MRSKPYRCPSPAPKKGSGCPLFLLAIVAGTWMVVYGQLELWRWVL